MPQTPQTQSQAHQNATPLRISELGAAVGVDVETIRYYEKKGLLPTPARSANGYRAYRQAHVERLAFIRHCRSLDMALADIAELLQLMSNPSADGAGVDAVVTKQLELVRNRLNSLQALEKQLMALSNCCTNHDAHQHLASECAVLQELVTAARGETCACHGHNIHPKKSEKQRL